MSKFDSAIYKDAVKVQMKLQKKSYADLAEHMNVSLVTVKRFLSKEEISFNRLLQICEWLEISLADLEKIAERSNVTKKIYFTEKQEKFLAQNPEYLAFLFNLYAEESVESIQKKRNLSNKSLNLYLIRLEKMELLKKVSGRYKPMQREFPSPIPYGDLLRSQFKNVLESGGLFFKRYNALLWERKNPELDKGAQTTLSVMSLSRASYLAWYEKYKVLFQELSTTARIEEKVDSIKDKQAVVLMHMHAILPDGHIEIESIKNMFGFVKEIT